MITELTPEQEAQLEIYAKKWRDIRLTTTPAHREEAERGLRLAYLAGGIQPPEKILWFTSPATLAEYRRTFNAEGLRREVVWEIEMEVDTISRRNVSFQVQSTVYRTIQNSFYDFRLLDFEIQIKNILDEQYEIGWLLISSQSNWQNLCCHEFYREQLGLFDETKKIIGYTLLGQNAEWMSINRGICLLAERRSVLNLDTLNRFHCENGLAIGYPDGWGVYAWHGVRVPEWVIMRPQDITPDNIMSEENAEIARVMLERYGQDNFIRDGGFSQVQSDDYGELYRVEFQNDDEPIVAVKVKDASTDREYFLYVPPHITSAHEGVAWTFGYDNVTDYNPDKET